MQCTVERLDDTRALLRVDDGQTLTVPRSELPASVREGDVLALHITTDAEDRSTQARAILNELLSGTDERST